MGINATIANLNVQNRICLRTEALFEGFLLDLLADDLPATEGVFFERGPAFLDVFFPFRAPELLLDILGATLLTAFLAAFFLLFFFLVVFLVAILI